MEDSLKENEKELIRLIKFFRERAEELIEKGKLSPEHEQLISSCEKIVAAIYAHANTRENLLLRRQVLTNIVKDNAVCKQCHKSDYLTITGSEKDSNNLEFNTYFCSNCSIGFRWSRPNNPWDMVRFIENVMNSLKESEATSSDSYKQEIETSLLQLEEGLSKLKPVVESSDREYQEFQIKETEFEDTIHSFRNHLLMQKMKMEAFDNQN